MRIHVYTSPEGKSESGLSLTEVKKRMRKQGGSGYTQHFDRDGSFQETTPIVLGNNARTTYKAEYNHSRKFRKEAQVTESASSVDVPAILDKVTEMAKAEGIGEEDNAWLMKTLGPMLGEKAERVTVEWYDWALCQIHGRLYHEFRGMTRSGKRYKAINQWKEENRKNHEKDNQL